MYSALDAATTSFLNSQILEDIGTLITTIISWLTTNSFLMMFLTIGLVSLGLGLFRALKSTARRG